MSNLYPLFFEPIYFERVWGGNKLKTLLNKQFSQDFIGESWEIVQLEEIDSKVINGFLEGNNLSEVIEIYMNELLGDQVYLKYGIEFPLLFKFIDANDKLSVQVHPNNDLAQYRHNAYGKTEMWYVIHAEPQAQIILGFKENIDKKRLLEAIDNKKLLEYLNFVDVKKGDVFYIPAGTVHALLKGVVVAEIQQNSDITYRLYDWDRLDLDGKPRKLHIDLALDAINYNIQKDLIVKYTPLLDQRTNLVNTPYFTTNLIEFENKVLLNYDKLDSFIVYMCIDGCCQIIYDDNTVTKFSKGQTILIPAEADEITLIPDKKTTILETYIPFVYIDED